MERKLQNTSTFQKYFISTNRIGFRLILACFPFNVFLPKSRVFIVEMFKGQNRESVTIKCWICQQIHCFKSFFIMHVIEAQNHFPEHSRSPLLAGGMTFLPYPECWIPVNLQTTTENSSLSTLIDFILKNKNICLSLYLFLLLLACTYLVLRRTSSVCLPLRWIASCIPHIVSRFW